MRHRVVLGLLGAALLAAPMRADDKLPKDDPASETAVQDLVYLSEQRPVLIRLRILVDGKPYTAGWESYVGRWFKFADRNDDGELDEKELKWVPPAQFMRQMAGGYAYYQPQAFTLKMQDVDANADEKVSPGELLNYYQKASLSAIQVVPVQQALQASILSEALFKKLDTDKDGKLSREELASATELIKRLDLDDDDLLGVEEVAPNQNVNPYGRVRAVQRLNRPVPAQAGIQHFLVVPQARGTEALSGRLQMGKQLIARYDKDKSSTLNRAEIGLDGKTFRQLDGNSNGSLDAVELSRWLRADPDVQVVVRLGKKDGELKAVERYKEDGKPSRLASAMKQSSPASVSLSLSGARLWVQSVTAPAQQFTQVTQYYLQLFRQADKVKRGAVTESQLEGQQFQYLRFLLAFADRDGDGMMTEKELQAALDLMSGARTCITEVSIGQVGGGLFELLDANRDGRLAMCELRSAWARLKELDTDNKGSLALADVPSQFELTVGSGSNSIYYVRQVNNAYGYSYQPVRPTQGPVWFRKMDRNGDGEVSRREFLGSVEDFKKIDTNGDTYLSLDEAKDFDTKTRSNKVSKR